MSTKETEAQDDAALQEAREALLAMARRVALLHMSYARNLVDALGEERGKALIQQAIWAYGTHIGERPRARVVALGHAPTPEAFSLGSDLSPLAFPTERVVVDGEPRSRAMQCVLAEVWREYGEEEPCQEWLDLSGVAEGEARGPYPIRGRGERKRGCASRRSMSS